MSASDRPGDPLPEEAAAPSKTDRRGFLRGAAAGATLLTLTGCDIERFLGTAFRELSKEELARRLERLERKHSERYGKPVRVGAEPPLPGVEFGYGLDLSRCIGCRRCVHACVKEKNQSRRRPEIQWIKVLKMDKARGVDLAHADAYYDAEGVPREGQKKPPSFLMTLSQAKPSTCCKFGQK